ncbi:MAG: hypothetical protein M0031_05300 [Thermaerobacter sp.]|nr:hypothetical protein [Thermaerobacter sp.]
MGETDPAGRSPEGLRLVAIVGFLGSGKTTLLLAAAKQLTEQGERVAIIVNEAGQVPIDGAVLAAGGTRVKEIFGGCFCCQLAGSLAVGLGEIKAELGVGWVFVEPSGLADPEQIEELVGMEGMSRRQVGLIDLDRIEMLREVLTPLLHKTVRSADLVLLNKADLVGPAVVEDALEYIRGVDHGAVVRVVSAQQGLPPEVLAEVLGR